MLVTIQWDEVAAEEAQQENCIKINYSKQNANSNRKPMRQRNVEEAWPIEVIAQRSYF